MNQREWKELSRRKKEDRPSDLFYYRNLAAKLLGYKRNSGFVIHHLRETEEQRSFNDKYYERWGIDFDGKLKYTVLLTQEEHKELHRVSEETRIKISKATSIAKTKYTKEEIKRRKALANRRYIENNKDKVKKYKKEYYIKNKEKIKTQAKSRRILNPEKHRLLNKQWKDKNKEYVKQKKREYYVRKKKMQVL